MHTSIHTCMYRNQEPRPPMISVHCSNKMILVWICIRTSVVCSTFTNLVCICILYTHDIHIRIHTYIICQRSEGVLLLLLTPILTQDAQNRFGLYGCGGCPLIQQILCVLCSYDPETITLIKQCICVILQLCNNHCNCTCSWWAAGDITA